MSKEKKEETKKFQDKENKKKSETEEKPQFRHVCINSFVSH